MSRDPNRTLPRRRALGIFLTTAAIFGAGTAIAEETDPSVVVEGRRANLRDLGAAFKAVNDELKKSSPSLPVIRQYARQIHDLAEQQRFWFPVGSGPQPDVETYAKPEIWQQADRFQSAQGAFAREAAKLVEILEKGDTGQIKAQARVVGQTCAGCHKPFRTPHD
jgi:cytochrome c556